jgi:hypothetical protein
MKLTRFYQKTMQLLASQNFFYLILVLLVFQALWIALSGQYPMAFDEDFHLGIIQIYAAHHIPFFGSQPAGADAFGAVARDPSYLYHYLMSFIYQPAMHFLKDQATAVIILRLFSIAFFTVGLVLFRRVLLATRVSRALAHTVLLLFILIPVVPFLAAQVNYDNLLMPLVAGAILLTIAIERAAHPGKAFPLKEVVMLLIVCCLSSLVKYAFLPIFAAIGFYLLAIIIYRYRGNWRALWRQLRTSYTAFTRRTIIVLSLLLLLSVGLFVQRYGHNIVSYKDPIPSCDKVLNQQECSAYGPWNRDQLYAQTKGDRSTSPRLFVNEWLYGLWFRSFFAVNGENSQFATRKPLPIPGDITVVLAIIGACLVVIHFLPLWRQSPAMRLSLVVIGVYCVALALQDFSYFHHTGRPVAINGRYLVPVLPLVFLWVGAAYSRALRFVQKYKAVMVTVLVLLMLQGGGVVTFIVRSDSSWYWHNTLVERVNKGARDFLTPFMIDRKPSERTGSIEEKY